MLGRSHVLGGALAYLALAEPVAHAAGVPLSTGALAAGAGVCAGSALLPDLDHPGSYISTALGPVTKAMSEVVSTISGGHRNGTHSLLFVAIAGLGTYGLVLAHHWAPGLVLLLCFALALRAAGPREIRKHGLIGCVIVAAAATWLTLKYVPAGGWLPASVAAGSAAHIAADMLTVEGCPLFWPISKIRLKLPVIAHTGNWLELLLATVMMIGVFYFGWLDFGTAIRHLANHATHFTASLTVLTSFRTP